jgi:predicted dehydrogenase
VIGVAIVGCGVVGAKRARALAADPGSRLVAVADIDRDRAERLAADYPPCLATDDWDAVVAHDDVTVVIVATTNDALVPITAAAVARGKHVLVEKPAARSATELLPVVAAAKDAGVLVKVGFNHRFHPAIQKARALFDEGAIGPLMYVRARYGHGGRLGYDQEWRADPNVAGGGELLDQGVHLIDLARWFAGDFTEVRGHVETFFWRMPVEDNAFLLLSTATGRVAWLHVSCTEWKNLFSFEIFGREGKLQVDGLGGSYGTERLTFHRMLPAMGPPETAVWEYPGEDESWSTEYRHMVGCLRAGRPLSGGIEDALAVLEIVRQVYDGASGRAGRPWLAGHVT